MPDKNKVFVSHASKDKAFAECVTDALEKAGVPCWIAPRDLPLSVPYAEAIIGGVESACAMVVILSASAYQSGHVEREVEKAVREKMPLFPLKIDSAQPSGSLEYFVQSLQHEDFTCGDQKTKIDKLVRQLRQRYRQGTDEGPVDNVEAEVSLSPAFKIRPRWKWLFGIVGAALLGALIVFAARHWTDSEPARGGKFAEAPGVTQITEDVSYRAVVVGISKYKHAGNSADEYWRDLPSACGDAEALAKVLESRYGFAVTRLFDQQATRSAIISSIDELAGGGPNTAALICFAGHGSYEKSMQEGYWIPADACKSIGGRPAKEDWIWNSTIQKIIGASTAQSVLVIADACYAGSLFNDKTQAKGGLTGSAKSRYLIASGGLEEVPDGGKAHSAFMKAVLDVLDRKHEVSLNAEVLGNEVFDRMKKNTGRTIAVGPLSLPGTGNDQFVFAENGKGQKGAGKVDQVGDNTPGSPQKPIATEEVLSSVLALSRLGATNSAIRLLANLSSSGSQLEGLVSAVKEYIITERKAESGVEIRSLVANLKEIRKKQDAAGPDQRSSSPRIIACIGPSAPPGASQDVENRVLLSRILLQSQVKASSRAVVVEREQLEQILREMELGDTDLSDPRTRLALGKLLQAGVMLFGEYIPGGNEDTLMLRVVDTETTQLLDMISGELNAQSPAKDCRRLGDQLVDSIIKNCPVKAEVTAHEGKIIKISAGSLHGVAFGAFFDIFEEKEVSKLSISKPFARAKVISVEPDMAQLELLEGQIWGDRKAQDVRVKEVALER
jgi:hypothetical protein